MYDVALGAIDLQSMLRDFIGSMRLRPVRVACDDQSGCDN